MHRAYVLLSLLVLMACVGCDSQKQDDRISSLEGEVKQLRNDVADLKKAQNAEPHHYELRTEGIRTWRFDSATGETCIELTSEADWKHKETKSESCACMDEYHTYIGMPANDDAAKNYYEAFVKPNCGN
jgi:Tfp pilus assembly protein PilP